MTPATHPRVARNGLSSWCPCYWWASSASPPGFFWAASNATGVTARALGGKTANGREEILPDTTASGVQRQRRQRHRSGGHRQFRYIHQRARRRHCSRRGRRDPTETPGATLKLQAIFYRPNNPTAIISSKSVSRGDLVLGARVLRIDRESVVLWVNGQTNVLTLP
jgi:hypothetical protein